MTFSSLNLEAILVGNAGNAKSVQMNVYTCGSPKVLLTCSPSLLHMCAPAALLCDDHELASKSCVCDTSGIAIQFPFRLRWTEIFNNSVLTPITDARLVDALWP